MSGSDAGGGVFIFILIALAIYFAPTLVAIGRGHRQVTAIFVLDLLLGWTLVGWVVALVWAYTVSDPRPKGGVGPQPVVRPPEGAVSVVGELERLATLRDKGAITEEEFAQLKAKAMGSAYAASAERTISS